jgi:hypothetical protein
VDVKPIVPALSRVFDAALAGGTSWGPLEGMKPGFPMGFDDEIVIYSGKSNG